MKKLLGYVCLILLCLGVSCSSGPPESAESVQKAVEKHLSKRTDLSPSQLKVTVDQVTYEGETASATVTIQAKDDPQAKMQMAYRLRKNGSEWQVEPQAPAAGDAHGGVPTTPPPAPMPGETPELPPGHPPLKGSPDSDPNALPPGHPPVGGQSAPPKSSTQ